jgi:hypothetical protein
VSIDSVERLLQRPPAKEEKANRGGQENSGAFGGPENLNWATGPTAAGNSAKMPLGQPRA